VDLDNITAVQNGVTLKPSSSLVGQYIRLDLAISATGPIQLTLPAKNSKQTDHQMINVVGSKPLF
jgi:hypothetical protein